jgi:hypothetical protein
MVLLGRGVSPKAEEPALQAIRTPTTYLTPACIEDLRLDRDGRAYDRYTLQIELFIGPVWDIRSPKIASCSAESGLEQVLYGYD